MELFIQKTYKQELSYIVSTVLERLGYGNEQRLKRKELYKQIDTMRYGDIRSMLTFITVGSKGEGLTNVFEKDRDILVIECSGVCVDEFYNTDSPTLDGKNVFTLKMDNSSPGHGLLFPTKSSGRIAKLLGDALTDLNGETALSSEMFSKAVYDFVKKSVYLGNGTQIQPRSGCATRIENGKLCEDHVYALECYCPTIIDAWASRKRPYDWPPREVIEEITHSPGYVVATGCAESVYTQHEWRLCFNIGEQKLVDCLNDIQIKLYVLLKLVLAEIIEPLVDELTSFMMKNIVFWLAERNPQSLFTPDSLIQWLFNALKMLQKCLKNNMLPYYMIPYRNLFAGKMNQEQREFMFGKVVSIIQEGPKFLLQSKRLHKCMLMSIVYPEILKELSSCRNEVEILFLKSTFLSKRMSVTLRAGRCPEEDPVATTEEEAMWRRMSDLIHPTWRHDAYENRRRENNTRRVFDVKTELVDILT